MIDRAREISSPCLLNSEDPLTQPILASVLANYESDANSVHPNVGIVVFYNKFDWLGKFINKHIIYRIVIVLAT